MEFSHLIANENGSVLDFYGSKIYEKTIIRNEENNKYFVFDSFDLFEQWYMPQKTKRYHEIILGSQIQRLKFDIDANKQPDIKKIINVIIDVVNSLYDEKISESDFIVTDSSGPTEKGIKYSYHIILYTVALCNNIEAKNITNLILKQLPKCDIDSQVNKNIQSFRLLWSSKNGRIKKLQSHNEKDITLSDTMIVPFRGIKVLKQLCENITNDEKEIIDSEVNNIIKIVEKYNILDGHTFRNVTGNTINFNRLRPTYCTICDEIHHHDNSVIIIYDGLTGNIYEFCRQNSDKKTRFICNINKKQIQELPVEECKFEKLPNTIEYNEPQMRDYEIATTLAVKAQMKVGKTKALHRYVSTYFANKVIRFVTFRQTFSRHVYNLFNDFELYSNIKGQITSNNKKVIIQVESLYRLQIYNTDLLILDEVESIFTQLGSGLHKNFNSSFAMFLWLLTNAKHVICMDANLSNRTFNILSRFRTGNIIFHHNTYKSAKNDIFYVSFDKNTWLSQLSCKLQENKKIVIVTNSIAEAKTCELLVYKMYPNRKIKMFSSEMKYSEKEKYFNNVDKYWSELDVLIYTPTCSAGVSYELEHFDVLFGYFCNSSCDVETCRQMMNRVRNLKSKEHYIFLQELDIGKGPTDAKSLHTFLYNKRNNLCQYIKDANLQYAYDHDGGIKFYETDYYFIWLENTVIANLSRNDFISRFLQQIKKTGAKVSCMDESDNNITSEHCSARRAVEDMHNSEVSNAKDLDESEIETIRNKLGTQVDLELSEMRSFEKFKLRQCYNFTEEMTPKFVELYGSYITQKIYHNLCAISRESTISQSLDYIIKKEYEQYNYVVTSESDYKNKLEYMDLNRKYNSMSHMVVSNIIQIIGIEYIDLSEINTLIEEKIWPNIEKNKEALSFDCNISIRSHEKYLSVNRLLKAMYGIRLYKIKNVVRLKKSGVCSLFTFSRNHINNKITIVTDNDLFLNLK